MLKLRKATVLQTNLAHAAEQELVVELDDGTRRPAIADVSLHGLCQVADEVIVNVQALDLGLGSGGFDILHVNLTRGLGGEGSPGAHVMKLNYSSLQHAVEPVEGETLDLPIERPVAVLGLHGQLAAVAFAFSEQHPDARLGFVQTPGGALPGSRSRTVAMLRERGLLAGHV
ncbi:MAG TPA: DUF3866 family protein, partial [Solirubrobacteraceae bacterium]|nr:DUF3866 family protein [Solirubrobacteraceae bacterium]